MLILWSWVWIRSLTTKPPSISCGSISLCLYYKLLNLIFNGSLVEILLLTPMYELWGREEMQLLYDYNQEWLTAWKNILYLLLVLVAASHVWFSSILQFSIALNMSQFMTWLLPTSISAHFSWTMFSVWILQKFTFIFDVYLLPISPLQKVRLLIGWWTHLFSKTSCSQISILKVIFREREQKKNCPQQNLW